MYISCYSLIRFSEPPTSEVTSKDKESNENEAERIEVEENEKSMS